jgi:hypothetical protein
MTITREQWLVKAAKLMAPRFTAAGSPLPKKIRYSCGWPALGRKYIGECWSFLNSGDGTVEIMISPALDDASEVLSTLLHELCHAALGHEVGHRAPFKRLGETVGLTGRPTHMAASPETREWFSKCVLPKMGTYPHAKISRGAGQKKQGTRLIKSSCAETGYTVRVTRTWLDQYGAPICPCCLSPMKEG